MTRVFCRNLTQILTVHRLFHVYLHASTTVSGHLGQWCSKWKQNNERENILIERECSRKKKRSMSHHSDMLAWQMIYESFQWYTVKSACPRNAIVLRPRWTNRAWTQIYKAPRCCNFQFCSAFRKSRFWISDVLPNTFFVGFRGFFQAVQTNFGDITLTKRQHIPLVRHFLWALYNQCT